MLASLRGTEVLARSRRARAGTTSFLDAQSAAFNDLALKTLLGGIGLLSSDHLDETEATGLLGVGIKHDLALLNVAVLLEKTGDLLLRETRVDTSHEEVGSGVHGSIIRGRATVVLGRAAGGLLGDCLKQERHVY
jgi:hypothetical protein